MELSGVPIPQMNWDSQNLPDDFKKFCEHADLIFQGPLKDKDESVQISYFLLWIGSRGRELHGTLGLTSAENKKLKVIKDKITKHLQPKINHVFARYKFNNEVQGEQTFEQFLTKLRIQAEPCNYREPDEMIRDRLVFGVKSPKIRERLINEGDKLTLDKAVEICQSFAYAQEQLRQMNSNEGATVNTVRTRQPSRYRPNPNKETRSRSTGQGPKQYQPQSHHHHDTDRRHEHKTSCDNCGYTHSKGQCPAKGKQCNKCEKWNHFAKKCRSKPVNAIHEDHSFSIDSVNHRVNVTDNQAFVEFEVGRSHSVQFKLDTGSQVNILPISIYNKVRGTEPLQKPPGNLTAYNGSHLKTIGFCTFPCNYRNKMLDLGFYIVDTKSKAILGLKACIDFGMIELVYSVDKPLPVDKLTNHVDLEPLTKTTVLDEYSTLFNGIGLAPGECDIHIDPNAQPVVHPPRRVPVALHSRLKNELERMEQHDVIAKVTTPTKWVNSLVIVEKQSGDLRVCLDPKDLNKAIMRPHYPMRTLDDVLPKLSGAKFFTKLDARSGYWTIKLTEISSLMNERFGTVLILM